eukprot:3018957-Pyramimonas_sp.AAC.1
MRGGGGLNLSIPTKRGAASRDWLALPSRSLAVPRGQDAAPRAQGTTLRGRDAAPRVSKHESAPNPEYHKELVA